MTLTTEHQDALANLARLDETETDDWIESDACIANIGPEERQRRMKTGYVGTAAGLALGGLLLLTGANRFWRLALFLPLALGASGFIQARDQTCVGLAVRGERNMDDGPQKIEDEEELRQVMRQAKAVQLKATAVAAAVTLLVLLLPKRGK